MYVINTETHVINEWSDTNINRQRLASGKYGVTEYTGEIETVDGVMYEKNFAPEKLLEETRQVKLAGLNAAFAAASEKAHCLSSAGFEINANEVANRNIESLILVLASGESISFRAYDNRFHEVTREQLETMRREIALHSQRLYQLKWRLEEMIGAAASIEELDGIEIVFDGELPDKCPDSNKQ